jgi:hypothetical protein
MVNADGCVTRGSARATQQSPITNFSYRHKDTSFHAFSYKLSYFSTARPLRASFFTLE